MDQNDGTYSIFDRRNWEFRCPCGTTLRYDASVDSDWVRSGHAEICDHAYDATWTEVK